MPNVVIVDWKSAPLSGGDDSLEREEIGDAAETRICLCDGPADFPPELYAAEVLILWHNIELREPDLRRLERCRAIVRNGVGFDSVDVETAAALGIPVCNVPDYGTEEVADHALALTLALCRQLLPLHAEARKLSWSIPVARKLKRLRGRCFAVLGLGRIGTAAALRAKAFGFDVAFYDPYLPPGADKALGVRRADTLEELLRQADVLSIHCPLNDETRHLVGAPQLAAMKREAFLVNTARGAVVDKAALLRALDKGALAGAGLDVIEGEPGLSRKEADTPNLILTCHAAFCSVESKRDLRRSAGRIARAALRGDPLPTRVN